jgi:4-cresol dehydrogenase (hydroxylating) cytochrome subunit
MKTMSPYSKASASILAAVAAVGVVAGIAWAAPQQAPEQGFAWKNGAEVYAKICAFCHETKIGPVIRGRALDPLYIRYTVRHGNRAMPAFRSSEIDDQSLEKVAEYVSKTAASQ